MMHPHDRNRISGWALPGPPHTMYWTPNDCVLHQRPNGSVVKLTRFTLDGFELADTGVAAWFGMELARIVADE